LPGLQELHVASPRGIGVSRFFVRGPRRRQPADMAVVSPLQPAARRWRRIGPEWSWITMLPALRNPMTEPISGVADATPSGSGRRLGLRDCLLQKCEVVATYAFAPGQQVRAPVMQALASGTIVAFLRRRLGAGPSAWGPFSRAVGTESADSPHWLPVWWHCSLIGRQAS
jgi:hypothetical protein